MTVRPSARPLLSMHNVVREVSGTKETTKRVLSDLNWQLLDGQRVGVISSSMNEAHAFLECAAGVVPVQKGEVLINAHVSWPIGARGGLVSSLTGRQNASLLQGVYGHGGERTQDLNTIAALADLEEGFFDKPLKVYNKFMRARFYLAVALAFDFDVFIIPKVFAWKTDATSERLLNLQQALRSRTAGKSLLMTHTDFAFLEQFCEEELLCTKARSSSMEPLNSAAIGTWRTSNKVPPMIQLMQDLMTRMLTQSAIKRRTTGWD